MEQLTRHAWEISWANCHLCNSYGEIASERGKWSEHFEHSTEDIVKVMGPMKTATTVMCEEQQPTVSVIAPLRAQLLKIFEISVTDSQQIKDMKTADLVKRYTDAWDVVNIAIALDPRFKVLPFLSDEEKFITFGKMSVDAATLWENNASWNI